MSHLPREITHEIIQFLNFETFLALSRTCPELFRLIPNAKFHFMLKYIAKIEHDLESEPKTGLRKKKMAYRRRRMFRYKAIYYPQKNVKCLVEKIKPLLVKRVEMVDLERDDGDDRMIERFHSHRGAIWLSLRMYHSKFRKSHRYWRDESFSELAYDAESVKWIENQNIITNTPKRYFKYFTSDNLHENLSHFQNMWANYDTSKVLTMMSDLNECCQVLCPYALSYSNNSKQSRFYYPWNDRSKYITGIRAPLIMKMWNFVPNMMDYEPLFIILKLFEESKYKSVFTATVLSDIEKWNKEQIGKIIGKEEQFLNMIRLLKAISDETTEFFSARLKKIADHWSDKLPIQFREQVVELANTNVLDKYSRKNWFKATD